MISPSLAEDTALLYSVFDDPLESNCP
jgi:hypothetical protein